MTRVVAVKNQASAYALSSWRGRFSRMVRPKLLFGHGLTLHTRTSRHNGRRRARDQSPSFTLGRDQHSGGAGPARFPCRRSHHESETDGAVQFQIQRAVRVAGMDCVLDPWVLFWATSRTFVERLVRHLIDFHRLGGQYLPAGQAIRPLTRCVTESNLRFAENSRKTRETVFLKGAIRRALCEIDDSDLMFDIARRGTTKGASLCPVTRVDLRLASPIQVISICTPAPSFERPADRGPDRCDDRNLHHAEEGGRASADDGKVKTGASGNGTARTARFAPEAMHDLIKPICRPTTTHLRLQTGDGTSYTLLRTKRPRPCSWTKCAIQGLIRKGPFFPRTQSLKWQPT